METISVTRPVDAAWLHMKRMLFSPFDFANWLALGFTAWLAALGEGGGGNVNFNFPSKRGGGDGRTAGEALRQAGEFLREWMPLIVVVGIVVLILGLALGMVFLWLRSRGKFMFLDNVVHRRRLVAQPWRQYARCGNSLFAWSLAFGAIALFVFLILGGGMFGAVMMIRQAASRGAGIALAVVLGLLILVALFVAGVVGFFLNQFVVPIMHRFECGAVEGWRRLFATMRGRAGVFALYALFFFALSLGVGIVAAMVTIMTCCFCCCALIPFAGPYVATVAFLPLIVFLRAYGVAFLHQVIPEVGLAGGDEPPPPPVPPPPA